MLVVEHSSSRSPGEKPSIERFEVIAQAAAREDVALEYLQSQMKIRPVPDSDHNAILMWLMRRFMTQRTDLDLNVTGQGLKVDSAREGRALPTALRAGSVHRSGPSRFSRPDARFHHIEESKNTMYSTPTEQLSFRKSSYSTPQNCVEVANLPSSAAVRDTQNRAAGHLVFPSMEWAALLRTSTR